MKRIIKKLFSKYRSKRLRKLFKKYLDADLTSDDILGI